MANNHRFTYQPQGSITTAAFIPVVNNAMRGLTHDLQSQVMFNDHLPRTVSALHTWSVPFRMSATTSTLATVANIGQLVIATNGTLVFIGQAGTSTALGQP